MIRKLLFLLMLCVTSIGAWADPTNWGSTSSTWELDGTNVIIYIADANDWNTIESETSWGANLPYASNIDASGQYTLVLKEADAVSTFPNDKLYIFCQNKSYVTAIDLSNLSDAQISVLSASTDNLSKARSGANQGGYVTKLILNDTYDYTDDTTIGSYSTIIGGVNNNTPGGGDTPGGETPGGETPGGETPGGETPTNTFGTSSWSWDAGTLTINLNATADLAQDSWSYGDVNTVPWKESIGSTSKVKFVLGDGVDFNNNVLYIFTEKMSNVTMLDFTEMTQAQIAQLIGTSENLSANKVYGTGKTIYLPTGYEYDSAAEPWNHYIVIGGTNTNAGGGGGSGSGEGGEPAPAPAVVTTGHVTYTTTMATNDVATINLAACSDGSCDHSLVTILSKASISDEDAFAKVIIKGAATSDFAEQVATLNTVALDLTNVTGADIATLSNATVKNLILPVGLDKTVVNKDLVTRFANLESAASLKALSKIETKDHYYYTPAGGSKTEFTGTPVDKGNGEYEGTVTEHPTVQLNDETVVSTYVNNYYNDEETVIAEDATSASDVYIENGKAMVNRQKVSLNGTKKYYSNEECTSEIASWNITIETEEGENQGKPYYWDNNVKNFDVYVKWEYKYQLREGSWADVIYDGEDPTEDGDKFVGYLTYSPAKEYDLTTKYNYTYKFDPEDDSEEAKPISFNEQKTQAQVNKNVTYELTKETVDTPTDLGLSLTAYVEKPATLAKTIQHMSQLNSNWDGSHKPTDNVYYWYFSEKGGYNYSCTKVTEATISGNLLAVDINCGASVVDENYHYVTTGGAARATLNTNNSAVLKYIDLSDAKFGEGDDYHPEDMTLVSLCHNKLETVILPTDASQTAIPDNCLNTAQSITKLCIPFNFQYIGEAAFLNSTIKKFTTTSPTEQVVNEGETNEHRYAIGDELDVDELEDHGPEYNSWTLPPFLKEIKTRSFQTNWSELCTDVYIFANPAPKCELNAFSEGMYTGWGGFKGNAAHPIQRSNYMNGQIYFTVLHYPSGLSDFERMHYTDITRKYTFMDETGATDDDGDTYYWPAMNQFYRAYDQAMCGVTWEAWQASRDWNDYSQSSGYWDPIGIYKTQTEGQTDSQSHLNTANLASYDDAAMAAAACTYSSKGAYQSGVVYDYDYAGWHQFVLVGATNFVEGPGKTYWNFSNFKENDWYTICVPFDLRKSDLLRIFGAKYDSEKEVKVGGVAITEDKYPDVRTLEGVTRDNQNLRIFLSLSTDLIDYPLQYESDGRVKVDVSGEKIAPVYGEYAEADPIIIEHDHPYYIKPVLPDDDMELANAGSRVLEYDPFNYTSDHYAVPNLTTYVYATNAAKTKYITKADVEKSTDVSEASYKYYFIGNYIAQNMPQYTYYVGKSSAGPHKMFRNTKTNRAWNAYTCVVGGVANTGSVVAKTGTDSQGGVTNAMVQFLADEDFTFGYSTAGAKSALGFGYLISMPEEDGTTTGVMIPNADGSMSYYRDNTPVYNVNGQKVGNSIHNLPKGLYIVNGKKFTVK